MLRNFFALCLVAALAFLGGRYFESAQVAQRQLDAAIRIQDSIQEKAAKSVARSEQVDQRVAASSSNVEQIKVAVSKRLAEQPKSKPEERHEPSTPEISTDPEPAAWELDIGTVGLLNAARQNVSPDTAGLSDAASQAPSGVGVEEFILNDLEIVRLYHELAERHNALVDYIESEMSKQAK